ncbi:hypothetical protein JCM10914A_50810 [Paenibacillus sp. JCM 10914]
MKKVTIIMILIFLTGVVYAGYAYIQDDEAKPTPVEAIEVVRGEGYVDYIIHQQPADEGEIIFFLRNIKDDNVVVNAEYVQKTRRGWIWGFGGGFTSSDPRINLPHADAQYSTFSMMYLPSTKGSDMFVSPFPMVWGTSSEPGVSRVVVKDYNTGLEKQATTVKVSDLFTLFYVLIEEDQGLKFDIIAYDGNGKELAREIIDEGNRGQNE